MTQIELARRREQPGPFIAHIENGIRRIEVPEFCAIARHLYEARHGAVADADLADLDAALHEADGDDFASDAEIASVFAKLDLSSRLPPPHI